jgi:hypothetical protein
MMAIVRPDPMPQLTLFTVVTDKYSAPSARVVRINGAGNRC